MFYSSGTKLEEPKVTDNNQPPPLILSPEHQSVNHSQRNSQITHSTRSTAQKQAPVDPASPANWLQMHLLQPRANEIPLSVLWKHFPNSPWNTSSQSFDFSSSCTFSKQKSLTSHLHLDVWIGEVQNNIRLQLWKALCLLEMDTTTEQNGGREQGKERERQTDTEAAGGTLMQSISAATCGYEAQSCTRACPVQQMKTNPASPPANARFSPSASVPPTSLSLCNQWREPIHVSYLISRGATGWNATPCMEETRGGKRS